MISDAAALQALEACIASAEFDTHLYLTSESSTNRAIGEIVEITVAPRFGFGLLVQDVGALLEAQQARVKEPTNFLLLGDLVSKSDIVGVDHLIYRYRAVLSFIQDLKRSAAFLDPDEPSLVFIKDGKFEIPIRYSEKDLKEIPLNIIQEIASILPDGTHEEQCRSIMAEAVIDMTGHLSSNSRFQHLLTHAADLKKRYEDGYRLFASGFSYDKVRDQVEAARIEYTGKIHKVFSDIQNQLLGIPVATVIVATQMKSAPGTGYEFWINVAVLIGCWAFALLMVFLLHNQAHTLDVINTEIVRQKRQLEREYSAVAASFSETFLYLTRRASTQKLILWTIDFLVVIGLLLSHIVFVKLTPAANAWLGENLSYLSQHL